MAVLTALGQDVEIAVRPRASCRAVPVAPASDNGRLRHVAAIPARGGRRPCVEGRKGPMSEKYAAPTRTSVPEWMIPGKGPTRRHGGSRSTIPVTARPVGCGGQPLPLYARWLPGAVAIDVMVGLRASDPRRLRHVGLGRQVGTASWRSTRRARCIPGSTAASRWWRPREPASSTTMLFSPEMMRRVVTAPAARRSLFSRTFPQLSRMGKNVSVVSRVCSGRNLGVEARIVDPRS